MKIFNEGLFKRSTFSPIERFSMALFQSKLDIAFLEFSVLAFHNPRFSDIYWRERHTYVNFTINNILITFER